MQIICGQCRHLFDAIDGAAATCPKCGHEVLLGIDLPPAAEVEIEADDFASIARSTMERKVHVICSRCNKTLTVGARLAGKKRKCPACQAAIVIPYPDEKEDFATLGTLAALAGEIDSLDLVQDDKDEAAGEEPKTDTAATHEPAPALAAAVVPVAPAPPAPADVSDLPLDEFAPVRRRPPSRFSGMLAGAVVLVTVFIAVGGYVAYEKLILGPGPELTDLSKPSPTSGATSLAAGSESPAPRPSSAPAPTHVAAATGSPSPTPAGGDSLAKVIITETVRSAFMSEGFRPAAPTNLYWTITVEVTAGTYAVAVRPIEDVFLSIDGAEIAALGTLTSGLVGPAVSIQAVNVKPLQTAAATFIFEVPQRLEKASLRLRNAAGVPITMEPYRAEGELAGNFMEAPPRSLPPLSRDPILAAVESSSQVTMRISPSGGDYQLQMPNGITGNARRAQGGLYSGTLKLGPASLPCKLRLLEGAKILILYIEDTPFHQITLTRE